MVDFTKTNQAHKLVDLRKCWVGNTQSLCCNTVERSVVKDNHTVGMKCEPLQCQHRVVRLNHNITKLILNNNTINEYITITLLQPTKLGNTEYVWINFLGNL